MNPWMKGLEAAEFLTNNLFFRVFPLCGVDRNGIGTCALDYCTESTGKHPLIRDWQNKATRDLDTIRLWWRNWPHANIGIATGRGFFVLDVDPRHGGEDSLADLEAKYDQLPDTLLVATGGGGWHYYFQCPQPVRNSVKSLGAGLDIRGDGGYVVGPGSRHVSGQWYHFEAFTTFTMAKSPAWLLSEAFLKNRKKTTSLSQSSDLPQRVAAGGRNNFLFKEALYHKIRSFSIDRTLFYISALNDVVCHPPLEIEEVMTIVNSVYSSRKSRS